MNSFTRSLTRTARVAVALAAVIGFAAFVAAPVALAETGRPEVSLLGGMQALNKNDTALADHLIDIPLTASVGYDITDIIGVEGAFSWVIPVKQKVDVGTGSSIDAKTPNILAYQANVRATLPLANAAWRPYATAGAGAVTFLKEDHPDRIPRMTKSQTAFAINFGAGTFYQISGPWSLRADFRELVAFPKDTQAGLSLDGKADPIWMERASLGFGYHF